MRVTIVSAFASLFSASVSLSLGTAFVACGGSSDSPAIPPPSSNDAGTVIPPVDSGSPPATKDAGPDVDNGAPSDTYPAPHPDVPQVVSQGGPVLKTPKVVPIFFPSYPYKTQIIDYATKVGATAYWKANADEYGVGALTIGTPVELTETPATAITDQQIKTWLGAKLDGTHPEFGAPDESTIYTIYYPQSTVIDLGQGPGGGGSSLSCQAFGGYHDNIDINGKSIAYAVIPECAKFHALTGLDVVTGTSAHEWIEAVTDPYPSTSPAYGGVDDDHLVFEFALGGGETGDMCSPYDTSFYKPQGFDYVVQRAWSNSAAKAGHDPCAPALAGQAYFNSAPC